MKFLYRLFLIIIHIIIIHAVTYSGDYKTLIDFTKFESINEKYEKKIFQPNKESVDFRKKVFNKIFKGEVTRKGDLNQDEFIEVFGKFIPWLKVNIDDMKLSRWAMKYVTPEDITPPPSKLAYKVLSPFSKEGNTKDIYMLGIRIHFPYTAEELTAVIKPPFEIFQYDKDGKFCNIGNGVLKNVGDVEKIKVRFGFKTGDIKYVNVFINLKDQRGNIIKYPLGFLYEKKQGQIKYYKSFDGYNFKEGDEIKQSTQKKLEDDLKKRDLYYEVYFWNNEQVLWKMIKYQRIVYHEITLEWSNSDYLPPSKKGFKKYPIYPKELPYMKFHSFEIKRQHENSLRQFYLFVKDVKIIFDKAIKEYDLDIKDDDQWLVMKLLRKKIRHRFEMDNAEKIYNAILKGLSAGYSRYEDFLKDDVFFQFLQ